ncbi:WD40-repeat-containing domain protein [Zopfochytrium polystomum]|nr:WD40-repeat-containing domain protein [Zopfochytrium polystomum]
MFDCTATAPADAATPNSLSQLAPEIAHRILVLVADYRSLARLCCVSKLWSIRAADDAYWRPLFLARWRAPRSLPNGTHGITLALESNEEGVLMTEDDDQAERVAWKKLYEYRLALDLQWTRGDPVVRRFPLPPFANPTRLHSECFVMWLPSAFKIFRRSDMSDMQTLRAADIHDWDATCVEINQEGTVAVTGWSDWKVRVWDLSTGACNLVLEGLQGVPAFVGWVRCFLFAAYFGGARVWDGNTGRLRQTLNPDSSAVHWCTNGVSLFSLSGDGTIQCWNPATGRCDRVIAQGDSTSQRGCGSIFVEARHIVTFWYGESDVCVRDFETGNVVATIRTGCPLSASVVVDSGRLVLSTVDELQVWDLSTGQNFRRLPARLVRNLSIQVDGTTICFADFESGVVFDFGTGVPFAKNF